MPKLIQINSVCNNSGGHIMRAIQEQAIEEGWETLSVYGRRTGFPDLPCVKIGNGFDFWMHVALTTALDRNGLGSRRVTEQLLQLLRREKPDVLQLHNVHGYYLNYPMLFRYLKEEYRGSVVWTMHDCWAYTGHCAFFTADCEKWKTGCGQCPHLHAYPWCLGPDGSARNWEQKRKSFCGVPQMVLTAPSNWLAGNIRQSFLREYPVQVIPNGMDPAVFHPVQDDGGEEKTLREELAAKYGISKEKKLLLGVASAWNERKGMEVFRRLAEETKNGELQEFCIVLVGMNAAQQKTMPEEIVQIERTADRGELAKLYSAAELLLNPSEEESFSMVTIEALACGTPVIALDSSAVKELVPKDCGMVLHQPQKRDYIEAILEVEDKRRSGDISAAAAVQKASAYTERNQVAQYMELYRNCLRRRKGTM